ncbi:MAG: arginine deiminase-related protein [Vulcanimicrobiaceae bacterium]|jgi:N-dimethylarginine dimethylaminohydrolase
MVTRFLVSPPREGPRYSVDAVRQWDRFVELAGCVGETEFVRLDPQDQAPDLVYTANAALLSGNLAILASFRHAERRREQPIYRAALARAGFATTFLRQTYFEGSGDALFDRVRPLLYAGYGWRTERGATLQLQEIVGCRVLPLLMTDEQFTHLDAVLCPLASGHVLAHLEAFSPHAQSLLRRAIEPGWLIEVPREDALEFVCNAVEIGDALVMHACSRRLRERLHDAGYRVFCTELSEFHRTGGSAKGLTLRLEDGPAVGMAAAAV